MKSEATNFYPLFKLFSINNNIDATVDILIESIDRFSFGDESDDENTSKNGNGEGKNKKERPNNYGLIKADNNLIESNTKLKDLNSIINDIEEIQLLNLEEKNNKGKICGIFNKEDFEIKLDEKKKNHKNNQLNDSFEKKYENPLNKLINLSDDEDDKENNNIFNVEKQINNKNNDVDIKESTNKIIKEEKEEKEEKKDEIKSNDNINNINDNENIDNKKEDNLINSNSKIKIDNYESDDIKNPEIDKTFPRNISPLNSNEKNSLKISKEEENDKEKEKSLKEEEINIKKNNPINEVIKLNLKDINQMININELESPRLGINFQESQEINKQEEEINNINNKNIPQEKEQEKIIEKEKEKENNININNKEEKQMNLPLSINVDNIYKKVEENIEKKREEITKEKKYEKNKNLTELKENSFVIEKTSNKEKKENDETNKKILELTQRLEKTEKESQKYKETNEKLMEVLNMFKNWQSIETKKTSNSGKNSRSDTPKRQMIKKKCFTPTLSKTNIIYGNAPVIHHKRSNSYNKLRVLKNNENKLFIDYLPVKQKTYRQLHGKENNQKKDKKINHKINVNNNSRMYGNYINRNTIYLTGANSNKYAKSPYLNNNMNYTGISYNTGLNNRKHYNSYNNYAYMNNSSQSFYINNNFDDNYINLNQRQVMQLPPNEQPLFYETKSNMNNNGMYQELIYNKNVNYNSENNFNRHKNIIENTNKYLQEMPSGFNNSNDLTLNNISENNNIKSKRNKNKLLDFKDFQIIFDESSNNHQIKTNKTKNDNKNIINNSLGKKNNNNNINNIVDNNAYNNFPNLINYREYSNYKINEVNKNNLNNENPNNFEAKKNLEKLSKGIEDDDRKKKSKGKNDNYNNLNFGIINNFNKNKKKNYKNNNSKNNNANLNSKEFGRNREKIEYNNCLNDSDDFNKIVKEKKKNNKKRENLEKGGKDYMLPFYLINRNEMLNNILNYISNDNKVKKRINNPINDKKKIN